MNLYVCSQQRRKRSHSCKQFRVLIKVKLSFNFHTWNLVTNMKMTVGFYFRNKSDCKILHITRRYNISIIKMLFISGKTKSTISEKRFVWWDCVWKSLLEKWCKYVPVSGVLAPPAVQYKPEPLNGISWWFRLDSYEIGIILIWHFRLSHYMCVNLQLTTKNLRLCLKPD